MSVSQSPAVCSPAVSEDFSALKVKELCKEKVSSISQGGESSNKTEKDPPYAPCTSEPQWWIHCDLSMRKGSLYGHLGRKLLSNTNRR